MKFLFTIFLCLLHLSFASSDSEEPTKEQYQTEAIITACIFVSFVLLLACLLVGGIIWRFLHNKKKFQANYDRIE